jgi:hypothetical protein
MTRRLTIALTVGVLACAALLVASFGLASAQAATKFGSDLKNRHGSVIRPAPTEPSPCQTDDAYNNFDLSKPCDRVAVRFPATGSGGNRNAPKSGTIKALRLVARFPGSFKFELAKAKLHTRCGGRRCEPKAKIVHRGPKIHYGSSVDGDDYRIQTFPVHLHVRKGEYLGIKANRQSLYSYKTHGVLASRWDQLLFQPVLPVGGPFEQWDSYSSFTLLLQAVYKRG